MAIVVLHQPGFPTLDAPELPRATLERALGAAARFVAVDALAAALAEQPQALVLPYGSAFPATAWPAMLAYLARGGSWVNLGGSPLARPVRRDGAAWKAGSENRACAQKLGLQQAYPVDLAGAAFAAVDGLPLGGPSPRTAWALQVRLAEVNEHPDEAGTQGQREARLVPLVRALRDGRHIASTAVEIERDRGEFPRGRWILAACDAASPPAPELIAALVARAIRRRVVVAVESTFAAYLPGETAGARLRIDADGDAPLAVTLRARAPDGALIHDQAFADIRPAGGFVALASGAIALRGPGFYRLEAVVDGAGAPIAAVGGFWVRDERLLASGPALAVGRDYFTRGGQPFPVAGTTYMSTVSHRRFLIEPTPAAWQDDFAAMRRAGINLVRTGVWYGWKALVHEDGSAREDVLRAFEAFLHAARSHDIAVIFTFFAFVPPAWGAGANPWLDPASIAAQAAFVGSFAQRFAAVGDLAWDFINEPSVLSRERLWTTRPAYDRAEALAWERWLASAEPGEWRERMRLREDQGLGVPALDDFVDASAILTGKHPLRAQAFNVFAQDAFNTWVAAMVRAARARGNPAQLVTVGQDEGGADDRPAPHLHAEHVDFTCNHPWWRNADTLWNSVITKTLAKPNLLEEVGNMFYERPDRTPVRSLERARNLLERKLVLSFAAGCAGFVQWLWNTNVYNAHDMEAGIGLLLADGSEKPELAALSAVAGFVARHARRFHGRALERCCIVVPFDAQLSLRNPAVPATRRAVRSLEYRLGIACRSVSDRRPEDAAGAALIVLPSPRGIGQAAWDGLLAQVEAGATLAVSGFVDADEWLRPAPRLERFGVATIPIPVHRDERAGLAGGAALAAIFDGEQLQRVDKAAGPRGEALDCRVLAHGRGRILWCPLPIELAQGEDQTVAFHRAAATLAGLAVREAPAGLLVRDVELADATLRLLVNESAADLRLDGMAGLGPWARDLVVPADRSLMVLHERDGRLIDLSLG